MGKSTSLASFTELNVLDTQLQQLLVYVLVCVCAFVCTHMYVHSSYADLSKFVKLWNKQTRILMKTGKGKSWAGEGANAKAGKQNRNAIKPLPNTKEFPAIFSQRTWQNHKVQKAKLLPREFNVLLNKNTSSWDQDKPCRGRKAAGRHFEVPCGWQGQDMSRMKCRTLKSPLRRDRCGEGGERVKLF